MKLRKHAAIRSGSLVLVAVASYSLGCGNFANSAGSLSAQAAGSPDRTLLAADMTALSLGANTVADIAQASAPAVVNIDVTQPVKMGNIGGLPLNMPGLPFKMDFFFNGQRMDPSQSGQMQQFKKHDTGSGFIIRADGYILTNAHVVGDADKITVTLNDKRTLPGKVVGLDHFSDLAVVKVDASGLPTLKMGTSSGLRPGEFAVAIGSPLGYDHTVTLGIISAVGRTVTDVNGNINFIQTDAAINPGNSGGPLLNLQGEVIGVNTAIRRDAQNIGFSIPVDVAKDVSAKLIAGGKILRPWLGIQMREIDEAVAKGLGIAPTTKGVVIAGFVPGSPGKAAGLQLGDIIQKIDGKDMPAAKDVKEYVLAHKVSDVLHFLVLRANTLQAVAVNVGDYQEIVGNHSSPPQPGQQPRPQGQQPPQGQVPPQEQQDSQGEE